MSQIKQSGEIEDHQTHEILVRSNLVFLLSTLTLLPVIFPNVFGPPFLNMVLNKIDTIVAVYFILLPLKVLYPNQAQQARIYKDMINNI